MHDHDVRAAVRLMLARQYAGDETTRIVEEMGIWSGSVRIDIAVIDGKLSGFELKSDRDTLERLPGQINLYSKVFDHVVLVVGEKHAAKAIQTIPSWWGVTVASGGAQGVELTALREAGCNRALDPRILAKLLWKDEAISVLELRALARGWRSKPASAIHDYLATVLTVEELSAAVRDVLKARQHWLRQSVSDEGQMPVHADLYPRLPTA